MIVYLIVHIPTEMSYIGSTERTLKNRFDAHWSKRNKDKGEFMKALSSSNKEDWLCVELERYDNLQSMFDGERYWILELGTLNPGVGYNSQVPRAGDIQSRIKLGPNYIENCKQNAKKYISNDSNSLRAQDSLKWWRSVSDEQKLEFSKKSSASGKNWWNSLTEEQKEEHRRKGYNNAKKVTG